MAKINLINFLAKEMKNNTTFQLWWSLFAGGVASALDLGIYFLLTNYFWVDYIVSTVIGFLIGTLVNYELNTRYVFSTSKHTYQKWLLIFWAIWLLWLLVTTLVMWLMVEKLHFDKNISRIGVYFLVFFLNFILRKKFIF